MKMSMLQINASMQVLIRHCKNVLQIDHYLSSVCITDILCVVNARRYDESDYIIHHILRDMFLNRGNLTGLNLPPRVLVCISILSSQSRLPVKHGVFVITTRCIRSTELLQLFYGLWISMTTLSVDFYKDIQNVNVRMEMYVGFYLGGLAESSESSSISEEN